MIEIKPIQPHQVEAVKNVILTVCKEIFAASEEEIKFHDCLSDLEQIQSQYFEKNGTFLVIVDHNLVVGSGGIRGLNNNICELKRMFLLPEYRGRGLGKKIAQMLLDFAQKIGYQKVRLDTRPEMKQALQLYKILGFYPIERYNDSSCTLFLEKIL